MENILLALTNDIRVTLHTSTEDEPNSVLDSGKEPMQKNVNTENTDESVAVKSKNDKESSVFNRSTPNEEISVPNDVNTQNTVQAQASMSTKTSIEAASTHPKEDWSSLIFSNDDSLFD